MLVTARCNTCRKTAGWHGNTAPGKAPVFHHVYAALRAAAKDVRATEVRLALLKAQKKAA